MFRVTPATVLRLAAEASRHPDTVRTVLSGGGNSQSREAVSQAAKRLGLALDLDADPAPLRIRST